MSSSAPHDVAMHPRCDIAKCEGIGMPCCERCVRRMAPAAAHQNWTEPDLDDDGRCSLYAPASQYMHLYQARKDHGR